ncbi:MAG: hypothetical protein ACTSSF_00385 [Candidatus Heimdallarchaeaceae archaeon]
MTEEQKLKQVKEQINEMLENSKQTMYEMAQQALNSGACSNDMLEDNYLLAKAIIDIWCRKRPYKPPLFSPFAKEVNNLAKFI